MNDWKAPKSEWTWDKLFFVTMIVAIGVCWVAGIYLDATQPVPV
ncbi:MAG: hypothetical protein ABJN38_10785 [Lentilitoribacter sp.]